MIIISFAVHIRHVLLFISLFFPPASFLESALFFSGKSDHASLSSRPSSFSSSAASDPRTRRRHNPDRSQRERQQQQNNPRLGSKPRTSSSNPTNSLLGDLVFRNVPSSPGEVSAVVVSTRFITLSWAPPTVTNGPIQGYSVFYNQRGSERYIICRDLFILCVLDLEL